MTIGQLKISVRQYSLKLICRNGVRFLYCDISALTRPASFLSSDYITEENETSQNALDGFSFDTGRRISLISATINQFYQNSEFMAPARSAALAPISKPRYRRIRELSTAFPKYGYAFRLQCPEGAIPFGSHG
jgi:hypothetical protein